MIDFIINGTICISLKDKDVFLQNFKKFLNENNAVFKGNIRIMEFENAEIIDD